MKINIQKSPKSQSGLLLVPIFRESIKKMPENYPPAIKDLIKKLSKEGDLTGKKSEANSTYLDKKNLPSKVLFVGLGKSEKYHGKCARIVGGKVGKYAKSKKITEISLLLLPEMVGNAGEILEGLISAQYESKKITSSTKKPYELKKLNFIVDQRPKNFEEKLENARLFGETSNYVKDLVNLPSNVVDGEYMEHEARRIAKENRYKIAVFKNKELKKMGWGGLLAVNQGAEKEACCLVLEYEGAKKKNEKPVVVVGKGVIFDTGGYNLKPTNSIETMHQDMAGGATVLGLFSLLKKAGIKKNVIGIVPLAENLVSDKSYRPSDIITMYSGKTVEITNTDAEGRLILADAIYYGTQFKPEAMITIATLTGAVAIALGTRFAGLVSNDKTLRRKLQKAGCEVDELAWPLPLIDDYRKKMDSKVADIRNHDIESGRYAGTAKAAGFLERFVEKNKWCHIDIGGTAFTDDPKEYQTRGATAHGLGMIFRFLENEAK